jgi:hypothetical protein
LDRWGPDRIRAVERWFAGPHGTHRGDLFVHARPEASRVAADGPVVVLPSSHADPDGEAAVAEPIHRGEVLRDLDGVV